MMDQAQAGRLQAPEPIRTSLDLYAFWCRSQGRPIDVDEWREDGVEGVPVTDRVLNAFPAFAAENACGFFGALHVTMGDGNLEDDNVEAAVAEATAAGNAVEIALARTLQAMSYPERVALYLSLAPCDRELFGAVEERAT